MRDDKFDVDKVDLRVTRPDTARILIAQATWPETHWREIHGLITHGDTAVARRFCDYILAQARLNTVQLVVFPELSIPEELLEVVRTFSEQTGAIVIAGSHYVRTKKGFVSRSPIVVEGRVYFTEKIVPAPAETSPIPGDGLQPGDRILSFHNTSAGNFGILICSDYLADLKDALPLDELDILCVPAFQRTSDVYHSRMNIQCEESQTGVYIAYANTLCGKAADGRSALFALMDRMFLTKLEQAGYTDGNPQCKICELSETSGYVIADLDLKHKSPLVKRNVHTRANVRIVQMGGDTDPQAERFAREIEHFDERYIRIRELFVPPHDYDTLQQTLDSKKMAFIVGDPGIGKTYTAARLLREYFDRGYRPIWHAGLERTERLNQRHILEHFRPQPKQIVYFEDPFGRTTFEERGTVEQIFGPLIDHLADIDARVVITSRREVFQSFVNAAHSSLDLHAFASDLSVVKPSYSPPALRQILDNIGPVALWFSISECYRAVVEEIEQGRLSTPLAIRHFVYSTENVTSLETLKERLQRRRVEERSLFAEEIEASGFRTKLVLALVFLYGGQSIATMAQWFNEVAAQQDPTQKWTGTSSLLEVLRLQTSYRVEQYGTLATVYRFAHTFYEEAFASAALKDTVTYDVLRDLAVGVGRRNVRTCVAGILRQSVKFPELTVRLLADVAPGVRECSDLFELSQLCGRLLALHANTMDERYITVLRSICTLDELINRINRDPDVRDLGPALRLCFNYARREHTMGTVGREWKARLYSKLDWDALEASWRSATTLSQQLEALWWATRIGPRKAREYLRSWSRGEILSRFAALTPDEKVRFLDVARSLPIAKELRKEVTAEPTTQKLRSQQWFDSKQRHTRGIVIDDGAVGAMHRKRNLLPVGIVRIIGEFERGEAISIFDEREVFLGVGIAAYSSGSVQAIRGRHSSRITDERQVFDFGAAVVPADTIITVKESG